MIRQLIIIFMCAAFIAGCETTAGSSNVEGGDGVVSSRELADKAGIRFRHLDAVNALRTSRGLPQLQFSQALNSAALTHARDMALQQRAWHFGSDRSNPQSRAARAGFGGLILGENISEAFDGDIETLQNWLNRPESTSVILSPNATSIGFAWFQEPTGKIWWVQLIARAGGIPGSV